MQAGTQAGVRAGTQAGMQVGRPSEETRAAGWQRKTFQSSAKTKNEPGLAPPAAHLASCAYMLCSVLAKLPCEVSCTFAETIFHPAAAGLQGYEPHVLCSMLPQNCSCQPLVATCLSQPVASSALRQCCQQLRFRASIHVGMWRHAHAPRAPLHPRVRVLP